MKTRAKFIVLHHKPAGGGGGAQTSLSHRAWLAMFILFFIFTFPFTLFTTRDTASAARTAASATVKSKSQLPKPVFDALLHYASLNASSASRMSPEKLKTIATVLRHCASPCNFLIFGLSHETLLWNSLNHKGRTVFVGDRTYMVAKIEEKH
ncbi:hypothetical protein C2S52_020654 [Perilla frutescens var. hirtella]|nr:hypothetical protein C2S52_020654 [Perilla frutescens var. hirtella]KAH6805214.1 hypothetical protein C2S51_030045 [Perilla frutescens var. frutescens]